MMEAMEAVVANERRLREENAQLKQALEQGRVADQCIVDEAVAAATKVLRAENARLREAAARLLLDNERLRGEQIKWVADHKRMLALVRDLYRVLEFSPRRKWKAMQELLDRAQQELMQEGNDDDRRRPGTDQVQPER